jgi:ribonuclease BN (tRNA processing enzyme)
MAGELAADRSGAFWKRPASGLAASHDVVHPGREEGHHVRAWLLGSGGWFPTDARETTAIFVREREHGLLLDAGTGARRLLTDGELVHGVTELDVILTHFHLDHVCGLLYLPGLDKVCSLDRPPRVWAPGQWLYDAPSTDLLSGVLRGPVSPFPAVSAGRFHELGPSPQQVGPFEISAVAQARHWHPTAGLRVNDELALITDTARESEHASFARGVHHILHEAWSTSADPICRDHDATARDAARTATDAGAQNLTLIHLNPQLEDLDAVLADARERFVATQLGEDGLAIRLSNATSAAT